MPAIFLFRHLPLNVTKFHALLLLSTPTMKAAFNKGQNGADMFPYYITKK